MVMQTLVGGFHYGIFSQISGQVLFWGRCQDFMKSQNNEINHLVKGYRELQIHEKIHNSSYRGRILPLGIFGVPLLQILCGYALVALWQEADLFQTAIFLVMYLNVAVFGVIIITSASFIYIKAEDWVRRVKSDADKNTRYWRKVHKSFRPLRLEFGNNYVDRLTPLMIQEFSISQTVSLLILARV